MVGKEQFDEFLGGSQSLPSDVHVMKLVSSRASEIAALTYSIENPQQTKLLFQKLPVYMRRRVMSHNSKRLPRRLREAHLNQMAKSGLPPKTKRPSRKYRRRPQSLLSEYNRRQRNKIWLETHIWHAKRFHMIEKWGYRIASHANDKCFKANYRAVAKHCLMQDVSYYTCFEINGPGDTLKNILKAHCNPFELTFAARVYIGGNREGTLLFFKKNGFPKSPIGYVHFLWRPCQGDLRTIWIWIHPSIFDDFLEEIKLSFEFESCIAATSTTTENCHTTPDTYNNNQNCKMNIFRSLFNRFRFYGPLTMTILTNVLRLPNSENLLSKTHETEAMDLDELPGKYKNKTQIDILTITSKKNVSSQIIDESIKSNSSWYTEYYSSQENVESMRTQKELWGLLKTLDSSSQLPPNIVLGFTVLDPRFSLPEKRIKTEGGTCTTERMPMPPTNANTSPIWEMNIRDKVCKAYVTTTAINKLRSQCLVPGIDNDKYFNENFMAKIPILLIQKSGIGNTGLSSGIDMILPSGWAMPFWLAFILRCVRVGALRESKSIAFEYDNTRSSEINDPDTPAYAREAMSTKLELIEKYFRYPPNRRVNFIKLGICSPFFCEWKMLMKNWSNTEEFFVLRNRHLLSLLQTDSFEKDKKDDYEQLDAKFFDSDLPSKFPDKNCLIRVKLTVLRKGCPKRFALICIPTSKDIEEFMTNKNMSGPVERRRPDPNETTRKTLRRNHQSLLRCLKRQRIRRKRALIQNFSKMLTENPPSLHHEVKLMSSTTNNTHDIIKKQSKRMSDLYLPNFSNIRYSCDREVMGFVTIGDFSFTQAKAVGLGYITLESLFRLMQTTNSIVLVRNTQTRQYKFARLEISTV